MAYISKGDWFDKGTVAVVVSDCRPEYPGAIFAGIKDGKEDEELCPFDEFDEVADG